MSKPNLVAVPCAAASAVGMAKDRAQGQLATKTATSTVQARLASIKYQNIAEEKALNIRKVTKYPAHVSVLLSRVGLALNA